MKKEFCRIMLAGLFSTTVLYAEDHVRPLDLTAHNVQDKVELVKTGPDVFEWTLPTPIAQTIHLDFNQLGISPARYDELRFDIQPQGSQIGLHSVLHGFPSKETLSSWYLKFKTPVGQWTSGRFDLRVDDDGVFIPHGTKRLSSNTFEMTLSRRVLGSTGEPTWRKALIRNPRLVRNLVTANFDLLATELIESREEVASIYQLKVKNQTDKLLKVKLEADSRKTLKYFSVEAPDELELKAGEERLVPVKLGISRIKAESLPPLYGEPCLPRVSVTGVPDSDYSPIIGFRSTPMWAVIPILNEYHPCPAETMAFLTAREKAMPGIKAWRDAMFRSADKAMSKEWPVYVGLVAFDQLYRCAPCNEKLLPVDETKLDKHYCPKCKKQFVDDPTMSGAYSSIYRSNRFKDIFNLALAYQLSGKDDYARKAVDMLYAYAEKYPEMPICGWRSTSGGSKLGGSNTLVISWRLPELAEAFHYLKSSPSLTDAKRAKIATMLKEEAFRISRHSVEYTNMQAEHLRAYGTAGLVTGFWPLVGEAVNGEFGWHEVVEYGYTEDGVSQEAGAYHRAIFGAMVNFSNFAYEMGANLLTPRFKRVFDGSLVSGATDGFGISYELAYRVYRDQSYLAVLDKSRANGISSSAAFLGILGLPNSEQFPVKSTLFSGTGYIFLQSGTASDNVGITMNYIKTFDRLEHDKFQTLFHRNGQQVDGGVGRITYSAPEAGWMEATAAHSAIVVDGGDQRDVDGVLLAFNDSPDHPFAVVKTDDKSPLYEGVRQIRGIALIDGFYVVFDRLESDIPRCFDRYQYGKGKASLGATQPAGKLDFLPERGKFTDIVCGTKGKSGEFFFENGLKAKIVSDQDFKLCKATSIKGYQPNPCDTMFARAEATKAITFLAAFAFGKDSLPPDLKILKSNVDEMEFQVGKHNVVVKLNEGKAKVD